MGILPKPKLNEDGKTISTYSSPSVQYLWPHHKKMARLVVEGFQPSEIAELTGFSNGQISRILGSPAFQAEVNRLSEKAEALTIDVGAELSKLKERSIEVLSEDLHMPVDSLQARRIRQNAAFDVLERNKDTAKRTSAQQSDHKGDINIDEVNIGEMSTQNIYQAILAKLKQKT